jgi:predicted Zn-dependent protease
VPVFYSLLIPWGYREAQDLEADRWALQRMKQAGRSRREIMAFLRKLEGFSRKHEFETIRKKPTDDPKVEPLDNHFRAHPIVRTRIKEMNLLLDPAPKSKQ